jgi:hypothetical protein
MWLQPIIHRGRLVACATATRVFLAAELERRLSGNPELRFVLLMCCYARDILTGALSGPYRDDDAGAFARAALIPEELLERPLLDPQRTGRALGVPLGELLEARREYRARQAARR